MMPANSLSKNSLGCALVSIVLAATVGGLPASASTSPAAGAVPADPPEVGTVITHQFWVVIDTPDTDAYPDSGTDATAEQLANINALLQATEEVYEAGTGWDWEFVVKGAKHLRDPKICSLNSKSTTWNAGAALFPDVQSNYSSFFKEGKHLLVLAYENTSQCRAGDAYGVADGWAGGGEGNISALNGGQVTVLDPSSVGDDIATSGAVSRLAHELGHNLGFGHSNMHPCLAAPGAATGTWNEADWTLCGYLEYYDTYDFMGNRSAPVRPGHAYMWGLLAAGQYQKVGLGESAKTITLYGPTTDKNTKQLAVVETPVNDLTYLVEHRVYEDYPDRNGIYVVSFKNDKWQLRFPMAKYQASAATPLAAGETYTGAGGAVRIYVQSTNSTSSTIVVNAGTQPYVAIDLSRDMSVHPAAAAGFNLEVKTNQSTWTATVPSAYSSWLSVAPTSGASGAFVRITRTANTTPESRIGRIDFTAGGATSSYWVVQAGVDECGATVTDACAWTLAASGESTITRGLQTYADHDRFMFTAPATGSWRFEATEVPEGADVSGELLNSNGNSIGGSISGHPYGVRGFSMLRNLTAGQTYYLDVYSSGWGSNASPAFAYTIKATAPTIQPVTIGSVTISGTLSPGNQLTATANSVSPSNATLTYEWYRASTATGPFTLISGATGRYYSPTAADNGKYIKVSVSGRATGYSLGTKSSDVKLIGTGTCAVSSVTVTGSHLVGLPETANVSATEACGSVTYQWYRSVAAASGFSAISGATGQTYVPVEADLNYYLQVEATVAATGFTAATGTSASTRIGQGTSTIGSVSIGGTARVGSQLTATANSVSPAGATVTYQWYRSGVPIEGATAQTRTVTASDLGYVLKVRATASAAGHTAAYKEASTGTVTAATATIGTVSISGSGQVGSTLTGSVASYTPAGATVTYRWYKNGVAINGATAQTYVVLSQDIGQALVFRATVKAPGYATLTKDSASLTPVATTSAAIGSVTITGSKSVGSVLTVAVSGVTPAGASVSFDWYRGSILVQSGSGRQYTLEGADLGQAIKVKATAGAPGYISTSKDSSATTAITPAALSCGTLTMAGVPQVGSYLWANLGYVAPASADRTYQWYRGSAAIPGATSSVYKVTAADAGTTVSVKVTLTLAGYLDQVITSPGAQAVASSAVGLGPVSITGAAAQGYTMTATVDGYLPVAATLQYQWYRGATPISGATGQSYTPVAADAAQHVWVRVTGSYGGYTTTFRDSSSVIVAGSGAGVGGSLVGADGGSVAGYQVEYAHYTCVSHTSIGGVTGDHSIVTVANGGPFAVGAYSGECYRLVVLNHAGFAIYSTWNGTTGYYHYVPAGSRGIQISVPTKVAIGDVTVTVTPVVGQTLSAHVANQIPVNVRLTYQWLRGGQVIPGATDNTYVPTAADEGPTIRVRVTASVPGWPVSVSKDSTPVYVGPADGGVTGMVTASDGGSVAGWRIGYDHYTCDGQQHLFVPMDGYLGEVELAAGGSFNVGRAGGDCYRVWLYSPGGALVASTWSGVMANFHYVPAGTRNVVLSVPTKAAVETVWVTGTGAVGYTLTANVVDSQPSQAVPTYQWYRAGVAIAGATSYQYKLVKDDAGQKIQVRATITVAGMGTARAYSNTVVPLAKNEGVAGRIQLIGGGSIAGYRVHYNDFTCDGLTNLTKPDNDNGAPAPGPIGQFQVGQYARECYRIAVYNADNVMINSTYGSTTANYHYIAAGTRNAVLYLALP
jgi:hypothetical protein